MFHYYPLGGDTVAPSGLYARLCHAFPFNFHYVFVNLHDFHTLGGGLDSLEVL